MTVERVHVIRHLEPHAPVGVERSSQIAWPRNSVQPFSSLWLIVQRFLILNRPSRRAFDDDFGRRSGTKTVVSLPFDSFSDAVSPPFASDRLIAILQESPQVLAWSQLCRVPAPVRSLFHGRLAWCKACLAEGFHTILFSLAGLMFCPIHREALTENLHCWGPVEHGRLGSRITTPGRCPICGQTFLSADVARRTTPRAERDQALADLTNWLASAGQRCWFPMRLRAAIQGDELQRHTEEWTRLLHLVSPPQWWLAPAGAPSDGERWTMIRHEFCRGRHLHHHLVPTRLNYDDASAIFKSMKRRVTRRLLPNARRWISALASAGDADTVLSLLKESAHARSAWALLLWWQASVGSVSLRDWFRRRPVASAPPMASDGPPEPPNSLAMAEASAWVSRWLYATSLAMLWSSAVAAAERALLEGDVVWGRGVATVPRLPLWSTATIDARLILCVDGPNASYWSGKALLDRASARAAAVAQECHRRALRTSAASAPCLWFDLHDGDWKAAPGPVVADQEDCRKHRLLSSPGKTFFVVVQSRTPTSDGQLFVARCLTWPVAVAAESPRQAIKGLKIALQRYLRQLDRCHLRST